MRVVWRGLLPPPAAAPAGPAPREYYKYAQWRKELSTLSGERSSRISRSEGSEGSSTEASKPWLDQSGAGSPTSYASLNCYKELSISYSRHHVTVTVSNLTDYTVK
jgi:hypothetical protein